MTTVVNDRIDVRISKDQKELIKYASELRGFKSLSEFIMFCVRKEANEIILGHNQILKSMEDKKIFLQALLHPPAPNAALKKAQLNYSKFIETDDNNNKGPRKKGPKK